MLTKIVFSLPSKIFHTIWFAGWFLLHLDINLLTLIVSLEAIYLELFLGDKTAEMHQQVVNNKGGTQ